MDDETPSPEATNPYAMPLEEVPSVRVEIDFAEIIRAWEGMRMIYIGVAGFFTLIMSAAARPYRLTDSSYWAMLIGCGIFANICYLAGPTAEGYGRYLGVWQPSFRKLLFYVGLAFTTLLAVLTVVTS